MRPKPMKDITMPTQASLEQAAREAWPDNPLPAVKLAAWALNRPISRNIILALARRIEAQQADDATVERVARALAAHDGIEICSDASYRHSSYGPKARAAIAAVKEG